MKRDRLLKSLLSQIGSKLISLAVAIGIGGWTARYLGPSALGTLSYVGAMVGLLGPLGNLGVKGSLSALLCANPPLPGLLGTALCIELVGTALVAIVLVPVALLAKDPVIPSLLALAVLANLFNSAEVFEAELFNRHRGSRVGVADITQTLIGAVASSVALLLQAPLLLFGALPAFQSLIRSCSLYRSAGATALLSLLASARWPVARQLIQRGWPLMLSGFAIMIYMKSDLVMLQWLRSSDEVGKYSVAVRVAESLYFLPMVLSQTFLPRLSLKTIPLNAQINSAVWYQLCQLSWMLGLAMAVGTLIPLAMLLPSVFGEQFRDSIVALQLLAPAAIAVSAGCVSGALLNLQNELRVLTFRTAIGASMNIILNAALIPHYGIAGAAAATTLSQFVAAYALGLLRNETRQSHLILLWPWR